jgi:phosphatidylserine decarboxylase
MSTKPKETLLTIVSDLMPRMGLVPEGRKQVIALTLNGLLSAFLAGTIFKKNKQKSEGWPKILLRNAISLFSQFSCSLAVLSAIYYRKPEPHLLGRDDEYLYAPADGKVIAIEEIEENKFICDKALRITISINFLDLHILRAPVGGQIDYIFKEQNASSWTNYIGLKNETKHKLLLEQITPHSSTWQLPSWLSSQYHTQVQVTAGQKIKQEDKIGVAAFGWQTFFVMTIPIEQKFELLIRSGQHVQAGMTVIGRFN